MAQDSVCSQSRTPSPVSKSRDEADLSDKPNYGGLVVFDDSEKEIRGTKSTPLTRLVEVIEKAAAFLTGKCFQVDGWSYH